MGVSVKQANFGPTTPDFLEHTQRHTYTRTAPRVLIVDRYAYFKMRLLGSGQAGVVVLHPAVYDVEMLLEDLRNIASR